MSVTMPSYGITTTLHPQNFATTTDSFLLVNPIVSNNNNNIDEPAGLTSTPISVRPTTLTKDVNGITHEQSHATTDNDTASVLGEFSPGDGISIKKGGGGSRTTKPTYTRPKPTKSTSKTTTIKPTHTRPKPTKSTSKITTIKPTYTRPRPTKSTSKTTTIKPTHPGGSSCSDNDSDSDSDSDSQFPSAGDRCRHCHATSSASVAFGHRLSAVFFLVLIMIIWWRVGASLATFY